MPATAGDTYIGRYKLVRELGRGGMGVVYLGWDPQLEREVALKLLPYQAEPGSDTERRFLREAKMASGIAHPNVISIYEVGESEQGHYVAMEYVPGETLRHKLSAGPLPLPECIRIGREIADAVQAAQLRGIVHRDIKPENVMVSASGHIKVLDFGLARHQAVDAEVDPNADVSTETQITQGNHVLGTTPYMSPEQLSGRPVDIRSDIFSLGVVLYEMLAGRRPFSSPSTPELISQIFHAQPDALARFNYHVPPELDHIVRKCLEKEPGRRYQTAQELSIDLANLERDTATGRLSVTMMGPAPQTPQPHRRVWAGAAAAVLLLAISAAVWFWSARNGAIDSIAVLPFVSRSGDANLNYLSEGLSASISDDLSRIPGLRISSQSVVQRYRGRSVDAQAVGRELNVKAVLSGQVGQNGSVVDARLELLDVATGARIWGHVYQRPIEDLAQLQVALSTDVASELRQAIGPSVKNVKRAAPNSAAYQLYLEGRFAMSKRTLEDFASAARYFQDSAEKDPSFALAYAGLSDAYTLMAATGYQVPAKSLQQAKAAALRALELDPNLSEARVSLAVSRTLADFDWQDAESDYRKAIELNPHNPEAHVRYAIWLLCPLSRPEEALLEVQRALDLDPTSIAANMDQGVILYFARRFDKAAEKFLSIEKLQPGFVYARMHLALAYSEMDRKQDAVAILEDPALRSKLPTEAKCLLGLAYQAAGRHTDALRLGEALEKEARHSYISPYGRAILWAVLGDNKRALELLEEAYRVRDAAFLFVNVDPKLDGIRSEPRFQSLLKSAKFL
ncbi:MAG: protein kinase [Acidobacteriota bacterium]|nr:protein kinase [Acidobacteriota bacterium]